MSYWHQIEMSSMGTSFFKCVNHLEIEKSWHDENVYIFCCLWQERLGKYGISCPINPTQKGVTTN